MLISVLLERARLLVRIALIGAVLVGILKIRRRLFRELLRADRSGAFVRSFVRLLQVEVVQRPARINNKSARVADLLLMQQWQQLLLQRFNQRLILQVDSVRIISVREKATCERQTFAASFGSFLMMSSVDL